MGKNINAEILDLDEVFEMVSGEEENLQLPNPSLLLKYKGLKERILWIDKDIDSSLMDEYRQILLWNLEDARNNIPVEKRKPIKCFIMSYGGTLDSAFAFCTLLNLSKTPIYTYAITIAMSAGCLIFLNGHKGHRYVTPMSSLLIHEGSSSGSQGTFSQQEAVQQNYKRIQEMMRDNILSHSNISKATWTKHKNKEWFLYCNDAIELGIADKIVDSIEDFIGEE